MSIFVKNPGFLTTVQDFGRFGFQQFGVPASGVMDRRSFVIGNILVGNKNDEPALEVTMLGPQLEFKADCVIALTGGNLSPTKNGQPLEMYRAVQMKAGDLLGFGIQKSGCRAYIAFAGGLDVATVMGSASTYLKAKLGGINGRQLQKGDEIALKSAGKAVPNLANRVAPAEDFSAKQKKLRVIMGPQDDAFTEKGISTFLTSVYSVTNQFDRMGCRLEGDAVEHIKDGNIISDGISFGAVQIPSEGKPIIMLADRQTTGGYTKIANVITVDFPVIAQSKFGDEIKFEKITVEEAQDLYLAELAGYDALRQKLEPATPKGGNVLSYLVTVGGERFEVTVQPAQ